MKSAPHVTVRGEFADADKVEALIQAIRNKLGSQVVVELVLDAEDILFRGVDAGPQGKRAS